MTGRPAVPPEPGPGSAAAPRPRARPPPPAAPPALRRACHARLCTLPDTGKNSPDHDAAACHHAMTSAIGVLVEDAGYHSDANLSSPGPDRLIADGKTRDLARRQSAS